MLESCSPQHPDRTLASFPDTEPEPVLRATADARRAQASWSAMPAPERAVVLAACAEGLAQEAADLIKLGVAEVGKPRAEMAAEVARGVAILRYYAEAALDPDGETYPAADGRSLVFARNRPRGVAGLVTPWNFPVAIPLWKAAPALAYGNAAVCKPAPAATAVALRLADLLGRYLPAGLFTVVTGGATAGSALVDAADAVSFTGSVAVGRQVVARAAARGVPVQAEMGGTNPSIVLPDANLLQAATTIAMAAMGYAGQKCTATSRVVVVGDPAPFVEALITAVEGLPVGDPSEDGVIVGPVISEAAREAVVEAAAAVRATGGQVLSGGAALDREGYYVAPTLVAGIDPGHRLAQEEVFGPFAVVLGATDLGEAVRIANAVPYGLAAAVFTSDLDWALMVAAQLEAGLVRVNAPTSGVDFFAPFGGMKASSYGPREQGKAARAFYTETQTVTVAPASS